MVGFFCVFSCLLLGLHFNLLPYGNYSGLYSSPWKPAFVLLLSSSLHAWFKEDCIKFSIFVWGTKLPPVWGKNKTHWINYSLIQASLNQSSVHQVTLSGEGIIPSCSKLLLSTAVVHTVVCKGVNIFIMFVKFILYTCRSRLLFCDIWGG